MNCKVALLRCEDDMFMVILRTFSQAVTEGGSRFLSTIFADENEFIECIVSAGLPDEDMCELLAHVLLAATDRLPPNHWLSISLSEIQQTKIALAGSTSIEGSTTKRALENAEASEFRRALYQAPLAVTMFSGPRHRISFANPAYLKILGKPNADSLLGREVREALPELAVQPFFDLLDRVYRTGEPYVGVDAPAQILKGTGEVEETYFDFVYHPLRNGGGDVTGILCIASDVKDRVLATQVSESRENQLFRQWAELETIYRQSPIGMCLLDAKDYRILRVNDIQAELMGGPASELIGKKVLDIFPHIPVLKGLYERVAAGESLKNYELTTDLPNAPGVYRTWLLNFTPVMDAFGRVDHIASTALEIT